MKQPDMTAADVINLCTLLESGGVGVIVDGGWSVDALLGKQLRPHKDLDIAVQSKDVPKLREILTGQGYAEVRADGEWNFVLADGQGREIDVHAFVYDDKGQVVDGIMYPAESLTGTGTIEGRTVKCIAPKSMVAFLAEWVHKWPEKYVPAIAALCDAYKIDLPKEYVAVRTQKKGPSCTR